MCAETPTVVEERTRPIPILEEDVDFEPPRPRGGASGRFLLILLWMLITMAFIAILGIAWLRETDRRKDAQGRIASAQAEAVTLRARVTELTAESEAMRESLASVRSRLGSVRGDATERKAALRQAKKVLARVAPLRKTYDGSERAFAQSVEEREAAAETTLALARDLAQFSRYLARTDKQSLNVRYLRAQARWLAGQVAELRRSQGAIRAHVSDHDQAGENVGDGFDALQRAITTLRKQIDRTLRR